MFLLEKIQHLLKTLRSPNSVLVRSIGKLVCQPKPIIESNWNIRHIAALREICHLRLEI